MKSPCVRFMESPRVRLMESVLLAARGVEPASGDGKRCCEILTDVET